MPRIGLKNATEEGPMGKLDGKIALISGVLSNVGVGSEFTNVSQMSAEERVMKCANPDFDHHGDPDIMNLRKMRVPELLSGSDLDPRISYPPVSAKSDGPKQLFIPLIPNSHQKLMAVLVRIRGHLGAPGIL